MTRAEEMALRISSPEWIEQAEAFDAEARSAPMSLYFIRATTGEIKIGVAYDPRARLATLQCGNPRPLTLTLAVELADAPRVERELHALLHEYRLTGEWFEPSEAVLDVIEHYRTLPDSKGLTPAG